MYKTIKLFLLFIPEKGIWCQKVFVLLVICEAE